MTTTKFTYDVLVIGAGHAGCEAAAAAARLGARTCLITMDMNKIAQMSCNPAVGGIAKGQIVREIDALGGQMGLVADATSIQFRMLNKSKGPAMWSPRAQCDRARFIEEWRHRLERTENLHIWQDEASELLVENGRAVGVKTLWGATFTAGAVIITAGTFLNGLMHVGKRMVPGGRCAEPAVLHFTESITRHGIRAERMKTGTPVRIDARSVHFEDMEEQPGETDNYRFSYISSGRPLPQLPCWTCNTNAEVHKILRSGLEDSPLYNGQIQSIGPRYCPSIETKLVTFADRDQHPLFLEPEGVNTTELYLNGFSSSLPMNVQIEALKQIPCFRDVVVFRPGYAIEYDFFDPTQLNHSLESKIVEGLYFAGQMNGTTGYEEAGGQGLMAGINAALKTIGGNAEPIVLHRDEAYIGVLIDDLVTKGVDEPYRMFTSRAEYRILLRQDNADMRLTPLAERIGLATEERTARFHQKAEAINEIIEFCKQTSVKANHINAFLEQIGSTPLTRGCKIYDLINRPQIGLKNLSEAIPALKEKLATISDAETTEAAEIEMKYFGYIARERALAEKMQRLEAIKIRGHFNYEELTQLSTEARQKLSAINPETQAQASRIPGVSPSDISVLLILLGR